MYVMKTYHQLFTFVKIHDSGKSMSKAQDRADDISKANTKACSVSEFSVDFKI